MNQVGLPEKQGLYDPQYEHDACGIGIVVNIKGKKSHDIVCQALTALNNLTHRGGNGSEAATGDGAGILLQVPDAFLRKTCPALGINLPAEGEYGVGMMFLPNDPSSRENCEKQFELIVKEEGQNFLGWRSVPNDPSSLGKTAKACMPFIKQVFISKGPSITDELSFERKLYVIRKRAEKELCYDAETGKHTCYFASLSSRTIVYKGMLLSEQVGEFYTELNDPELVSALAMVHSRFSTNTFPSWERAHPNRYIIHNGEINTIRGNENWMYARQSKLKAEVFGDDMQKLFPIINTDGSDSAKFDNSLEFLNLSGMPLPRAVMMMIPEPWSKNETMSAKKKAYYEYLGCLMEPWDGPAAIGFTDGRVIGAVLDRNGLRPSRYYVTKDDMLILASEVGVLDIAPENVLCKERLHPGKMLLVDTIEGRIISDEELKEKYSSEFPYEKWLKENMVNLSDLPHADEKKKREEVSLIKRQRAFGYTYEDIKHTIQPMAFEGVDPVGAMGIDTPLAVLSDKSQLLYNYFKQLFAQVTNPPIDAIREEIVTGNETYMGSSGNPLKQIPENARQIKLDTPVITDEELERLKNINIPGFKSAVIHILYKVADGVEGLERAINNMCIAADRAFESGKNIIILSDRGLDGQHAAIPALLAVSALHHHTINNHRRTQISIVLESAEPREVHHFACLLGYGASAINPYLVFETIEDMASVGFLEDVPSKVGIKKYIKCVTKGVVKILSKMGISTIKSYRGAQIFEAIGIGQDVIDKYFRWTPSRIGGIGLPEIAEEIRLRHQNAFDERLEGEVELDAGGSNQWRKDGEYHMYNPETIFKLQQSVRNSDYNQFKEYTKLLDDETQQKATLRGLMKFKPAVPVSIEEVESVDEICKRFKTGAMSYGSISKEAHEALAIAMNRLGGKSNTGEGGEDPARFIPDENGDSRSSAIKQVASGRFGVTSHYLVNALELQIKMAQGAKPGEGGQLPGKKVYPWVARTRHSTPGVGLISPPPHHDIYSIEDLSELIHDLKNANRKARISVKLVSEVGVGTIAAGVAKGRADVILVSGYDGGTGASPRTSIKHAGLPWELGLAETHQTLMMNDLRSRVIVETDGKLMTGRDVVVAALLGAEEYGFATAPLVTLGCVMMRVCNLDTCPVGVATQNPELRAKFCGKPEYVVNFMKYIAQEMREIMAQLGFRTINEMVGRSDMLEMNDAIGHWKTKGLDFSAILNNPFDFEGAPRICMISQDHGLENSLDIRKLLDICKPALENGEKVSATLPVKNTDRVVGTILGSE
ncbi:MAG: glutamate synthase large subunit, partial [Clostridiales bacterium]|nr:glutamate synthase large subunit [Clostridiales bacterium]